MERCVPLWWFTGVILCVLVAFCETSDFRAVDNEKRAGEEHFGSKSHGGTVSNNDFSLGPSSLATSEPMNDDKRSMKVDEESRNVTSDHMTNDQDSDNEMPVTEASHISTTTGAKSESKKDPKRKNRLGLKKKDKILDDHETGDVIIHESKHKMMDTTKEDATSLIGDTEPAGTINVSPETKEYFPETTTMAYGSTRMLRNMSEIRTVMDSTAVDPTTTIVSKLYEGKQQPTTRENQLFETTETPHSFDVTNDDETHPTNPSVTLYSGEGLTDETRLITPLITTSTVAEDRTSTPTIASIPETPVENDKTISTGQAHVNEKTSSDSTTQSSTDNTSNNNLEDYSPKSAGNVHFQSTVAPLEEAPIVDGAIHTDRRQKQMDLDNKERECFCDQTKVGFEPTSCRGERTAPDPQCMCRNLCARQAGEPCSSGEPCDEEFGLHCDIQNATCQGQLAFHIFDVTHNTAKVNLGLSTETSVFYTKAYRGSHTQWTKVEDIKPVIVLENLIPGKNYYLKVEEDGKQEISTFKTKDNVVGNMPKILVKQRSQSSLTVVWDDFRLPSYHSEYILEYRPADAGNQNWTKVQAGTQTIVTVTHLTPNTPYQIKVAVWEDEKLELPSEVITAYTADGCVKDNKIYNVGEEYFIECEFRCVCRSNNETDCSPRCNLPYVKLGSKTHDPMCYENPIPSDPCCVTIRCTESKALEDNEDQVKHKSGDCPEIMEESESTSKSCLSDCDFDASCSGNLKCCPSSCGGAVCVQPIIMEGVCENIYCGPNAVCVPEKVSCECSNGYEGNPHDFLNGCFLKNATEGIQNEFHNNGSSFELDFGDKGQREPKLGTESASPRFELEPESDYSSKNELETNEKESKESGEATEAPFELDLTSHLDNVNKSLIPDSEPSNMKKIKNVTTSDVPNDEENFHLKRPQDVADGTIEDFNQPEKKLLNDAERNQSPDEPVMLFDGCEYNNITYDRGVRFDDACEARCVCDGPGHVSCVPRCPVLSSGGPACLEIPDPDDNCCKIMVCSFPGSGEIEQGHGLPLKILSALAQNGTTVRVRLGLSISQLPVMVGQDILEVWFKESADSDNDLSQWNKKPITQKDLTEVQQGVFEFDINDLMPETDYYFKVAKESQGAPKLNTAEFSNTVNVRTFPAAVRSVFQVCFHHNQSYGLGEVFFQGCEYKCVCREKGFIECQDRCEIYVDAVGYEGCDWVPSEEDSCCTIPSCQRRKIPLLPIPDGRPSFMGETGMCVLDNNDVYRVGDIWESGDGCKTKICRCTLLSNGSTSIQCQSECPPLPPNAHIPTARCPHPVLIKPDGPCSCPYVGCNDAPRRIVQPPRPQCEYKSQRYDMGQEFHDGCIALCHCGQDLRVNCAAVECPYHFSAEFTNCLEWDIDPEFFPSPPHCCAPAKCKNDGSCIFSAKKFNNFQDIPSELLPCGARCVCVNGNVTCENRCPPIEDIPPINLPCSPNMAFKGQVEGETCCLQWMCKEPIKQAYCMFQGARYLVSEQWEVRKGSQHRLCTCHLNAMGASEVECKGGCPQIPQRFLLPTEQCVRPVTVTPEDPVMCPYVVCNNTLSGQELYNVNVVALNSTAVRIRFSLSNILISLVGHAELHFTTDPTLPPSQWHIQKFSRPKRLFDSPNIEYVLNALRPNTTYFLQVKIKIDALQGGPESELFKLRMPEEIIPTTTTTIPPMIMIDAKPEAHVIDANTIRISWRNFEPQEKKFIYALQLKYKLENEADDKWITTPMIHRDVSSYFLHNLEPSSVYLIDMIFTPPKDLPTKLVSAKPLEIRTIGKTKDNYHLQLSVEDKKIGPESSEFSFVGIPEPITKQVHVIKVLYKTVDGEQLYNFKVPKTNEITLDHLKPGMKYLVQLELYLTNGQTLTSNEVEFITKAATPGFKMSADENAINNEGHANGKQAELLQSKDCGDDENKAYFIALVVVAVVAAVAGFGFVLLLVLLVKRQASAKAPISRTPSESAYDNPTYKTYDGERPEDKTNGSTIQTTQA